MNYRSSPDSEFAEIGAGSQENRPRESGESEEMRCRLAMAAARKRSDYQSFCYYRDRVKEIVRAEASK